MMNSKYIIDIFKFVLYILCINSSLNEGYKKHIRSCMHINI